MSLILSGTDGLSDVDGSAATPAIRGTDANTGIFFPAADTIAFSEGGAEVARFDSSGNFGLGVTPSAWQVNNRAIQIYEGWGSISANNSQGCCDVSANCFNTGSAAITGWKYTNSSALASLYQQSAGVHKWLTAPSGTAGNPITFTQAMTLDASGNLALGSTTSLSSSSNRVDLTVNGTSSSMVSFGTGGTRRGYALHDATDFSIASETAGALRFLNNGSERARIDSSGNLLVGTTSFSYTPSQGTTIATGSVGSIGINHANGTTSGNGYMNFVYNTTAIGSITQNGTTAVAYNTTSDYRLKKNVQPLAGALSRIAALKPCTYTWKSAPDEIGEGFIAHELQEVCPQAVTGEKDAVNEDGSIKPQSIDTSFLVATLTAAIQEQQALITTLTARITALESA